MARLTASTTRDEDAATTLLTFDKIAGDTFSA
jgi:hypothetical protein